MKTAAVSSALLLGAVAVAGGAWQTMTLGGGSFSVAFPGKPMVQQTTINVQREKVPTEIAAFGMKDRAYVAMTSDFSKYPQIAGREDQVLDMGVASLSKDKGYDILSVDNFTIQGRPGRHVVLRKPGIAEQQVYAVFSNSKVIFLIVGGKAGATTDKQSQKFVSSFKLR